MAKLFSNEDADFFGAHRTRFLLRTRRLRIPSGYCMLDCSQWARHPTWWLNFRHRREYGCPVCTKLDVSHTISSTYVFFVTCPSMLPANTRINPDMMAPIASYPSTGHVGTPVTIARNYHKTRVSTFSILRGSINSQILHGGILQPCSSSGADSGLYAFSGEPVPVSGAPRGEVCLRTMVTSTRIFSQRRALVVVAHLTTLRSLCSRLP